MTHKITVLVDQRWVSGEPSSHHLVVESVAEVSQEEAVTKRSVDGEVELEALVSFHHISGADRA